MKPKKLHFVVNWNSSNINPKAWSGTNYGLFKSLKKYFDVIDVNVYNRMVSNWFYRLYAKFFVHRDLGLREVKNSRKKLKSILKSGDFSIIFQFAEIVESTDQHPSYIYQDLSVSYVDHMCKKLPEIFAVSGFANIGSKYIEERMEYQNVYYHNCRGIFTMGEWFRKYLVDECHISSDKVWHVGGGINLDKSLIVDAHKENNKILFVGRDFKRKNGYLVYEAFVKLKKEMPQAELHVAGPQNNPISSPIEGYYFYGDSSHEQLSELFNKCDIFCMPSIFEAYGLVFIEALTYGLPCIGRNAYEMPYFIQDKETGYLLNDKNSVDELSHLMKDLLRNERIKQNVVNKRDWYLKEYSWSAVANRINCAMNGMKEK